MTAASDCSLQIATSKSPDVIWVDFRRADPEPFERLVWGITQQRSEP